MTELPEVDAEAVDAYWQRCIEAGQVEADAVYADADCFGDSPQLADELLDLILHGPKRATAATMADHEHWEVAIPQVGDVP